MTNNRYTDEEIKIALANCAFSAYNPDACTECHYNNVGAPTCVASCTNDALYLINRQKSEIERLKSELSNTRRKALLEASSKFAGHSNYHGDTVLCKLICMAEGQEVDTAIPLDISKIKTEAYKEFAMKLKEEDFNYCIDVVYDGSATVKIIRINQSQFNKQIDSILKEMTGE